MIPGVCANNSQEESSKDKKSILMVISAIALSNLPEGKIDPGQHLSGCFGHLMFPIGISMSCHKQKGTMMQGDFNLGNIFEGFVTQTEQACFPKSRRCDVHVFIAAAGFIAVPSNAVTAVPV